MTSVGEMLGFPKGSIVDFVVRHKRKQVKPFNLPGAIGFNRRSRRAACALHP